MESVRVRMKALIHTDVSIMQDKINDIEATRGRLSTPPPTMLPHNTYHSHRWASQWAKQTIRQIAYLNFAPFCPI